ncbi:MAG: hypothetical protein WA071_23365 [Undibacterium umbellatum]|jgi:hypothetical protein|uniref:hypothetical protein n=1 Tax=Undibacterium TaxID=401469 RepID=UPI00272FD037|nr:hypothetical protein [Undibacterium sp.]MDP1977129.1 hypothetical protein [Undibacterium sp.]
MPMLLALRRGILFFMLAVLTTASLPAFAQIPDVRNFPENTKRGVLNMSGYPDVLINGKAVNTAPGLRIFDDANLFVSPSQMTGNYIIINYVEDNFGDVTKIWVLNEAERKLTLPPVQEWKPQIFKNKNF